MLFRVFVYSEIDLARDRWKSSLVKLSILFNINASFFGIFRQGLLLLAVLVDEAVVGSRLVSIVSYIQLVNILVKYSAAHILVLVHVGCCAGWKLGLTYTNKLPE